MLRLSLLSTLLLLMILPLCASAATINVPADHATIQAAVDAAAPDDDIVIAAGIYREQITIGKSLTLTGAGVDLTVIEAVDHAASVPTTITGWNGNTADVNPCILALDAGTVEISGLTVDGRQIGGAGFYGVYLHGTSGAVRDCRVTDILDAAAPGSQSVVSLVAHHDDQGGGYEVAFENIDIPEFQKCGILVMGPGLEVELTGNTIVNAPSEFNAGNGIQISYGATGVLTGNTVQGIGYTGEDWTATGILLFEAGDVTVSGGEIFNCETGLGYSGWGWRYLPPATPRIVLDGVSGHDNEWNVSNHLADDGVNLDYEIRDCDFRDNMVAVEFWASDAGGTLYDGWSNATLNAEVTDNDIIDNEYGLYGSNTCLEENTAVNLTAHGNDLSGSTEYGMFNEFTNDTFDATGNWWGDATGPNLVTPPPAPRAIRPLARPCTHDGAAPPDAPARATAPARASDRGDGVNVSPYIDVFPWSGTAALAPVPAVSGPINCSQTSTLAFRYTPDALTPELRGYELTVRCDMATLDFTESDVTDSGVLGTFGTMHYFDVVDNLDDTYTISGAILGGTVGLDYEADLFTIDVHGGATGTGAVEIIHYKLRDLDNGDIFATLASAAIEVDCTPPDVPVMTAEPAYTPGSGNTVHWSDESGSGATEYLVQRATDSGFTLDVVDSGWIALLEHTFSGLTDGQIYYYRVMARDALANASAYSAAVFSTQDATAPASAVDALPTYRNTLTFDVPYTATDATSGVASVELFYDIDYSGAFLSYGTFAASPISFTAAADGVYEFYTRATDAVGNVENAPATADAVTIVDVTPPAGTFVINNGDVYTNDANVSLNSGVTDLNPPLQMRLSEDGVAYDPWMAYAANVPYILPVAGDGTYTMYAQYRDAAGNILTLQDDIVYDVSAPGAVTGLAAETGHGKVTLHWSDPADTDIRQLVIYRGVWHDGANASAYPEYDDLAGITVPTRPATHAAAAASPEWIIAGAVPPGTETFVDTYAPRGRYWYEIFVVDLADNYGGPAAENDDALNYWLGDVSNGDFGLYDGLVNFADITGLGAAFGTVHGDGDYENEVDVGPTDDMSVLGVPTTDNVIDLEDLMMFAINYDQVAPLPDRRDGDAVAKINWYRVDELTWALALRTPCADLKGLQARLDLPAGAAVASLAAGGLLQSQGAPWFLDNIDRNGLDINLALMGRGATIQGDGQLLQVTLTDPVDLDIPEFTLRCSTNAAVEFELETTSVPDLPTTYRMAQNYPNPFNPKTTISFDLPEGQQVRLSVFGADGRLVRTLVNGFLGAGRHAADWDGRDETGAQVSSGIYFYSIEAGPLKRTSKMLMLK